MDLCTSLHRLSPPPAILRRHPLGRPITASLPRPSPIFSLSKLGGAFGSSKGKRGRALLCFPDETSTVVSDRSNEVPVKVEEDRFEEVSKGEADVGGDGTADTSDNLDLKWNPEDTSNFFLYGSGALVALWLTSAIVNALDSLPLFPKVMEFVGLSFTVWFSARYLIFKNNRDELMGQIETLKEQIIGLSDD